MREMEQVLLCKNRKIKKPVTGEDKN